ncbi:MAG TPA: hypothetical protein VGI46_12740 [Candidatus Acidoferrum sp.]|jgi:hypothetical protein
MATDAAFKNPLRELLPMSTLPFEPPLNATRSSVKLITVNLPGQMEWLLPWMDARINYAVKVFAISQRPAQPNIGNHSEQGRASGF